MSAGFRWHMTPRRGHSASAATTSRCTDRSRCRTRVSPGLAEARPCQAGHRTSHGGHRSARGILLHYKAVWTVLQGHDTQYSPVAPSRKRSAELARSRRRQRRAHVVRNSFQSNTLPRRAPAARRCACCSDPRQTERPDFGRRPHEEAHSAGGLQRTGNGRRAGWHRACRSRGGGSPPRIALTDRPTRR